MSFDSRDSVDDILEQIRSKRNSNVNFAKEDLSQGDVDSILDSLNKPSIKKEDTVPTPIAKKVEPVSVVDTTAFEKAKENTEAKIEDIKKSDKPHSLADNFLKNYNDTHSEKSHSDDSEKPEVIDLFAQKDEVSDNDNTTKNEFKPSDLQYVDDDETFKAFFGKTVAVDYKKVDNELKRKKNTRKVNESFEPEQTYDDVESEEQEDYEGAENYKTILGDLRTLCASMSVSLTACVFATIIAIYIGFASVVQFLPIPTALIPLVDPNLYLIANIVLLVITMLISITTIINGFAGIFGEGTSDTLPTLACVSALFQCIVLLISPGDFGKESALLFAPIALLILSFNTFGKYLMSKNILNNFKQVGHTDESYAGYILRDKALSHELASSLNESTPNILVSKRTQLVKNFLKTSFSKRDSDDTLKTISLVVLGLSVVGFIIPFFLDAGIQGAATSFAAILCIGAPLANSLVSALPTIFMQKSASKVGAVIPGFSAIDELSATNVVKVNAKDLFPSKTISLHGVKTFEKERIHLSILYAASILIESQSNLKDIFLTVIENNTSMLYDVKDLITYKGLGYEANIENSRVHVGGRELMEKFNIGLPDTEYEEKYTKGVKSPVYLAIDGKLLGMFVVNYQGDKDIADILIEMQELGVSMLVDNDDFNITAKTINFAYGMPYENFHLLTNQQSDEISVHTAYEEKAEGALTFMGTFASLIYGMSAAVRSKSSERATCIIHCVAACFGAGLALLLTITSGISYLGLGSILLYHFAWLLLTISVPTVKKY